MLSFFLSFFPFFRSHAKQVIALVLCVFCRQLLQIIYDGVIVSIVGYLAYFLIERHPKLSTTKACKKKSEILSVNIYRSRTL